MAVGRENDEYKQKVCVAQNCEGFANLAPCVMQTIFILAIRLSKVASLSQHAMHVQQPTLGTEPMYCYNMKCYITECLVT
jgi:hypothetical protein